MSSSGINGSFHPRGAGLGLSSVLDLPAEFEVLPRSVLPTAVPHKGTIGHSGEGEAIRTELPAACFWLLSLLSAACPSFLVANFSPRQEPKRTCCPEHSSQYMTEKFMAVCLSNTL